MSSRPQDKPLGGRREQDHFALTSVVHYHGNFLTPEFCGEKDGRRIPQTAMPARKASGDVPVAGPREPYRPRHALAPIFDQPGWKVRYVCRNLLRPKAPQ